MTLEEQNLLIRECRSWKGTKWMHRVALKGYRVDCVYFIMAVAKEMGWLPLCYEPPLYPRDWHLHSSDSILLKEILKFGNKVENLQVGDVILYKFGKAISHAAWYLGKNGAIHSHMKKGVVEFNIYSDQEMKEHQNCIVRIAKWR